MGEIQNQPFQLSFNSSLKVDFQGSRVTSDGGLILVRELDERLGFGDLIAQQLTDSRRGKNTPLPLADLLRQSVYSRIAGYEDVNDAERVSQDPTFRLKGKQAGGEDDAAELPPVPVQPGAPLAELARLQPWESVAAAGATEEDRELVADEFAAKAGEDGWPVGQARAVLGSVLISSVAPGLSPACAALKGGATPKLGHYRRVEQIDTF